MKMKPELYEADPGLTTDYGVTLKYDIDDLELTGYGSYRLCNSQIRLGNGRTAVAGEG